MTATVRLDTRPYGDSAVLVRAHGGDAEQRWRRVQSLAGALGAGLPPGVENVVATYDCVLVEFDPDVSAHRDIARAVSRAAGVEGDAAAHPPRRLFRVPVVYGGEHGPDLDDVADWLGMTATRLVEWHGGVDWIIRFRGAPVGAPMMEGPRFPRPVRRHPEPRIAVQPGSVALAGEQGVIYPVLSPGGWRIVGRTPLALVDFDRNPPMPYRSGDRIRFVPMDRSRWAELADRPLEPADG
ncbi:5-oxoprolinase subunit B family protein [Pseudonocardia acaciae]|uniref:5-oxoprolinase subunit B family protein n=1 Tax=Pseudonocardia acaciae TaxID=551276 RepID=UPI00055B8BD2|nr:carboxyltransferase domain-containing protein [Pseudonocardia acaciae]